MTTVVPPSFLFRYSVPVPFVPDTAGSRSRKWRDLSNHDPLPNFGALENARRFAELRVGWNDGGIGFLLAVRGKRQAPYRLNSHLLDSDGLQVWIDTRNTQNVHRPTRFCHHFCAIPAGPTGKATAMRQPMTREIDDIKMSAKAPSSVASRSCADGYDLNLWIPAESLVGFDPIEAPALGFYYTVTDRERGNQFLTVDGDFPFATDPSLWSTLELIRPNV